MIQIRKMSGREAQVTSLERDTATQLQKISKLSRRLHAAQVEFIKTELKVGLAFASFALAARRDSRRARCERIAQQAYNAASRFAATVKWSAHEHKEFARKLQRLKAALAGLPTRAA